MWCKYILARHVTLSKVDCAPRAILSRSCGAFFHVCTSIRMSCTCACVNVCVVVTSLLLLVVHVVQIYISTACDSVKGGLRSSSYFESFMWCNFSMYKSACAKMYVLCEISLGVCCSLVIEENIVVPSRGSCFFTRRFHSDNGYASETTTEKEVLPFPRCWSCTVALKALVPMRQCSMRDATELMCW
jgi:hypothetical protein